MMTRGNGPLLATAVLAHGEPPGRKRVRREVASCGNAPAGGHGIGPSRHPPLPPKAGDAANYGMPVSRTVEKLAMELAFLSQQVGVK